MAGRFADSHLAAGIKTSLTQLEVLVVDCQATGAAANGHLLEIGWARVGSSNSGTSNIGTCSVLIKPPADDAGRIPPAVARITGISERMVLGGVDADAAWRALSAEAARLAQQPAPTVIHFARFEQPFLYALAGGTPPLDLVCTHDIARRLLPDLPRRSLRALAGYFGRAVGTLRRSADHVNATVFVWQELVRLLDAEGVSTWSSLHEWLAAPVRWTKRSRHVWPMPRDVRLALPDAPGIYRLLRTSGDVLYVGKATSLCRRVNSYFRKQGGVSERMLEMLSQARAISFDVTPSALEAALVEPDEIKRHQPPYNIALTLRDRAVWFTALDFSARSVRPSPRCRLGPFPSAEVLDEFAALTRGDRAAAGGSRWGPDASTFGAGFERFHAAHPELSRCDLAAHARLLRLGTRLWREGRRVRDADENADDVIAARDDRMTTWTPELVQLSLEWVAVRAALARRRARWLTRLVDATVVWTEPGAPAARLIVIDNGEVVLRGAVDAAVSPPIPPGHRRAVAARQAAFTVASFDRLRVLTTELKRLVAAGAPVALRLGLAPALSDRRLASALSWV